MDSTHSQRKISGTNKLINAASGCVCESSATQLNSNASKTPRCAVLKLFCWGFFIAWLCSRCCFNCSNILANLKWGGFCLIYLPTNSIPKGRYPNHSHISWAIANSLFTLFFPTKFVNNSKASSGDNTSKAISSTFASMSRNLVVITTRKRWFVGSNWEKSSILVTSSSITNTRPDGGFQFVQHQVTCSSKVSRFPWGSFWRTSKPICNWINWIISVAKFLFLTFNQQIPPG